MIEDRIGSKIGNYQLLRVLGKGSFATVYLAEHLYLEVPAAIKLLHTHIVEPTGYEQFRSEARTIAHLQHPHIVRVLDFGIQEQAAYLVMEYMPYGALRARYPKGTRLPLAQILTYVQQIASALDYAHRQGLIHRDIKPENILLNAQNEAVLSDFGIAIMQQTLDSLSTQKSAGTPLYMAPEQLAGRPTTASDQYALGILVYEWLTGTPPFQGSILEVLTQQVQRTPPPLRDYIPSLSIQLEQVVLKALAKDPAQRFASIQEFANALEQASGYVQARQSTPRFEPGLPAEAAAALNLRTLEMNAPHDPIAGAVTQVPFTDTVDGASEMATPLPQSAPQTPLPALSTSPGSSMTQVNRQRLLRRVRSFWIEGVLQHSLHGAALIALGLQEQPDALANPWPLALQSNAMTAPRRLPAQTSISQVYDTAGGELLILGAPGSGKTTILLELTRDLLERAENDPAHPIPVVFPLSSWASKQQRLTDWFVEELLNKYQVPRKLGRILVNSEQLLPLLDGLDEVAPRARVACIEAINQYRREHGLMPLVVSCRYVDYLALDVRVRLDSAVVVQPLNWQQIEMYVQSGGEQLQALRLALRWDAGLRELASTPLMLSILTLAYQGATVEELMQTAGTQTRQREVFKRYVERMLTRGEVDPRYPSQKTVRWLSWLAKQLVSRNQTVFSIERMQPDWLPGDAAQMRYSRISAGLIFGQFGFVFLGPGGALLLLIIAASTHTLSSNSTFSLGLGLLSWFMVGSLFGLINALTYGLKRRLDHTQTAAKQPLSRSHIGGSIARGVLNGTFIGLLFVVPMALLVAQQPGGASITSTLATTLPIVGSISGLLFILIDSVLGLQMTEIRPTETFAWSNQRMLQNLARFLGLGLAGSVLLALPFGLIEAISNASSLHWQLSAGQFFSHVLTSMWEFFVAFGLFFGMFGGLLGALTGGVSSNIVDVRNLTRPNQGMRRSARYSLLIGFVSTIISAIASGLFTFFGLYAVYAIYNLPLPENAPLAFLFLALVVAFFFGPLVGMTSGLRVGGVAYIQHFVLRWLLWRAGSLPWSYARFLDYAAGHVLLSKIGGGYMFVHRFLLEYFASLDEPSSPSSSTK